VLKGAAATSTVSALFPHIVPRHAVGGMQVATPSETVNVIGIGTGNMVSLNIRVAHPAEVKIVALCDVDENQVAPLCKEFPDAVHGLPPLVGEKNGIEAVIVATPEHPHATITVAVMELGKHVYCEQPLAHTVYECRMLTEAAREQNQTTQLGNQGHSFQSKREFCKCIWSGTIGKVREVHGAHDFGKFDQLSRINDNHTEPKTLDWDLWLGPAAYRKFNPIYHPGAWRNWRQFGGGNLGEFLCHIADPVFWALDLLLRSWQKPQGTTSRSTVRPIRSSRKFALTFQHEVNDLQSHCIGMTEIGTGFHTLRN